MTIIVIKRSLIHDDWCQNYRGYTLCFWSMFKSILFPFLFQQRLFKPSSY